MFKIERQTSWTKGHPPKRLGLDFTFTPVSNFSIFTESPGLNEDLKDDDDDDDDDDDLTAAVFALFAYGEKLLLCKMNKPLML